MAKLYVFGIGGTGSRVIKSLVMLLAAGVKVNATEIIPIIIDPHKANDDLRRTLDILKNYQRIYNALGDNRDSFFNTKIETLAGEGEFVYRMQDVNNEKFKEYIGFSSLDESNKALAALLFSEKTLEVEMDIGFVGNPNIGSVVLNQFRQSEEFKKVASNFGENDRIFIISSIFGGTGAAGFPILAKNFRNANSDADNTLSNKERLANAKIGAVSVLPYFGVKPDENKPIQKADFIVKTKSALSYYEGNLTGQKGTLNAHYTIGDIDMPEYDNDPGEGGQENPAHFIEMAAALSIVDFMEINDPSLETVNGKPKDPRSFEFGIKEIASTLNFPHLGTHTQTLIAKPLSKYYFFQRFLTEKFDECQKEKQPFILSKPVLDASFSTSSFYRNELSTFNKHFKDWLTEMGKNKKAFKPFIQDADLPESIEGIEGVKGLFIKSFEYKYIIKKLNEQGTKLTFTTSHAKLVTLFDKVLEDGLKDKFPYFN